MLGLLIAIGALFLQLNRIAFGEPKGPNHKVKCSYVPMVLHLGLVLIAGVYLPASLVAWRPETIAVAPATVTSTDASTPSAAHGRSMSILQ